MMLFVIDYSSWSKLETFANHCWVLGNRLAINGVPLERSMITLNAH